MDIGQQTREYVRSRAIEADLERSRYRAIVIEVLTSITAEELENMMAAHPAGLDALLDLRVDQLVEFINNVREMSRTDG